MNSNAQEFNVPESFKHLKQVHIDQDTLVFAFLPNNYISDFSLPKEFIEDNYMEEFIGIVKTDRSKESEYLLSFTTAPSLDHTYSFYKKDGTSYHFSFSVGGKQIYIPGNGNVYVSGHTNNLFNEKLKYTITNDSLKEVNQALKYVGLKTKLNSSIVLYSDKEKTKKVAFLPKNSEVTVLLNERYNKEEYFLIKTSFGLVGWCKLDHYYKQTIQGIFFKGD